MRSVRGAGCGAPRAAPLLPPGDPEPGRRLRHFQWKRRNFHWNAGPPAALCALVLVLAPALGSAGAELRDIRSIVAPDYTRLVLDLGERVSHRLQALPANEEAGVPPRLYVDLEQTRLGGAPARLTPAGGPLVRLRAVQVSATTTRIILDVPGLSDYRAFPLLDPYRLVVDVHGTPRAVPARPQPRVNAVALPPPAPPGGGALHPLIVLDPGHGGMDPGASGAGGAQEKDIVLSVARALRDRLQSAGYRVLMTRDEDVFVSLEERAAYAVAARADLFISLHANASPNAGASGIETYYLSNSGDRATVRLAGMENHLAHMTGKRPPTSDVSWIVSDMIQSYKVEESVKLARHVQSGLISAVRELHPDVNDLGAKPGPFYVLVGAGMPAVLVELSFLTHPEEGRRLSAAAYQRQLADGVLRGITEFAENGHSATTL